MTKEPADESRECGRFDAGSGAGVHLLSICSSLEHLVEQMAVQLAVH
ncbi:MAG: hypothetical protein OSB09_11725 [Planctomycetota bacterium]|nr:hypothetical protein [Planctomycetota bacterium]